MTNSSSNKLQEGPKLFSSRILSKDRSSVANASFRVYYSLGAGTVPFVWESKPGTPKSSVTPASSAASAVPPPPISPPPSYQQQSASAVVSQSKAAKKLSRRWPASWSPAAWIIGWLNLTLNARRRSPPSSMTDHNHQQRCLAQDDDHGGDHGDERRRARRSTLCF